jgi:hypothetical protein
MILFERLVDRASFSRAPVARRDGATPGVKMMP